MNELVKRLRERAEAFDYDGWVETASDYEKAADAIEELQKRVPKRPHGRLIDADELHSALRKRAKEFSNSEYGEGVKCGLADAREYIKIATTIIPAEGGES